MPVMIDLETLGTSARAPVIAIGAADFNFGEADVVRTFYRRINWTSAMDGREPDAETIRWWMGQSDEARDEIAAPNVATTLERALKELHAWFPDGNSTVWGNGSSFDITILEDAYRQYDMKTPWKHWNVRDMRTLVELGHTLTHLNKYDVPFTGTKHVAVDDAVHQAKVVQYLYKELEERCVNFTPNIKELGTSA